MKKTDFYFKSQDRRTQIHAISWAPEGKVRAVLQICHGMVEYIDRYDAFATYLTGYGFYVVGNDHLGHGESVVEDGKHGFFAQPGGNECVIGDIHFLRKMTMEEYPEAPYFMLGHSMGSFLLRQYIESYGKGLTGAVIMGTGTQPGISLKLGKMLCRMSARFHGWDYRSSMIDNMAFGSYNKAFEPARTPCDWLTKDTAIVDAYCNHPWCTFKFTVNGYYALFTAVQAAQDKQRIAKISKKLPLLVVSGAADPVGANGKGVRKAYQLYEDAGIEDVQLKLYENDRHEILNEVDRDGVYYDIMEWLRDHCPAVMVNTVVHDENEVINEEPEPGPEDTAMSIPEFLKQGRTEEPGTESSGSAIDSLAEDTLKILRHF